MPRSRSLRGLLAVNNFRLELERRKGKRDQIKQSLDTVKKNMVECKRTIRLCEKAIEIVKIVGLETQKQLEYHLSEQVSLALASVFDDPYQLKVVFQEKRGKTEAELLFERDGVLIHPIGSAGGGAIDVASLGLRLAYWSMRQDKRTRPLFLLDEPFARLKGEEANRRALNLLRQLSAKLGIQIIMISDERIPREDIIENADRVFLVTQRNGVSKVKQL